MQLNPKQEEAKNKIDGPLLILAGAGSGKTATLTARVVYMIQSKNILQSNIMMVTFTNKAASEMRERVAKSLGITPPKNIYNNFSFPLIGTFHSIGIFILKDVLSLYHPDDIQIGLKKDFVIYDEHDKLSILKNIIKNKLNLEEKEYPAKQIAFYISNAKNHLIDAASYEKEVDSMFKEVVFKAYTEYEKALTTNNAMDFDDILIKTYKLLEKPKILEMYQERYKYIMVDEYQDTNLVQYYIVKLLASKYKNLAVVGDDSQSIYSWRGADMRNIINFKKDYPEALVIKLEQNYRSTKKILAGANSVIANNNIGIKKELWTENDEGEMIEYIEAPTEKIESEVLADIIEKKTDLQNGGKYKDNLVLYRTNAQSRTIEEALISANIPYRVIGGIKFYDRAEIKDLLAYLKVIYNPQDIVSLKRIINKPSRKIGDKAIQTLDGYSERYDMSYFQIFENIDETEGIGPAGKNAIKTFYELYENLVKKSAQIVVSELIGEILKNTLYIPYLTEGLPEEERISKIENIDELINLASEYNGMESRESLQLFLEDIAIITDMDVKDNRSDYVTLMTIHTSKGLEEKRVFITGLEDGLFPNIKSMGDTAFIEEERRLMYVAMTRAREELYISRAIERFHFGEFVRNPESRFIKEISNICIQKYDLSDYVKTATSFFSTNINSSSSFNFNQTYNQDSENFSKPKIKVQNNDISSFNVGDKVTHPKFGGGIITELNGEIASIAFTGNGTKKMNIKIAPVRKV